MRINNKIRKKTTKKQHEKYIYIYILIGSLLITYADILDMWVSKKNETRTNVKYQ
jgi:hypothetical protein